MNFRLVLCAGIALLSYMGGILYTWRFTGRILILRDARDKLSSIEREMLFSLNTLPDICESLSNEGGAFSSVMKYIAENINYTGASFQEIWREAVFSQLNGSSLKSEQIAALASMGRGLGEGDVEEQKKCFARINSELEQMLAEAESEKKKLKKMYMSIFMFTGLGLSIVLI